MSDLGWRGDGIARALAAGGIELERYRRPGFTGGMGVRRVSTVGGSGFEAAPGDDGETIWDARNKGRKPRGLLDPRATKGAVS